MVACVAALTLAGCINDAERPRQISSDELNCAASIDTIGAPHAGYQSILDVIALPDSDVPRQLGRTDPDSGLRFAKMGLLVGAGEEEALITVDSGQEAQIRIGWGTVAVGDPPSPLPVEQIVVPGCESDSEWVVYAGGIWVGEPAWVGLTVSTGGRSLSIRIPIDTGCS